MREIRVSITLRFALRLTDGEYQTARGGEQIRVSTQPFEKTGLQSNVSATFHHDEISDPFEKQRVCVRDADSLLRRANRLLRWYRAVSQDGDFTESDPCASKPVSIRSAWHRRS